jgi:hypothetical protein
MVMTLTPYYPYLTLELCVKYGISRAIAFVKSAEREKRAERNKTVYHFVVLSCVICCRAILKSHNCLLV